MLRFNGCNTRRVHTAHLASANTDGLTVFGVDNGVGFHEFSDFPGEDQVVHFRFGRGAFGCDFKVIGADHTVVTILNQQATVDALVVITGSTLLWPLATFEQADVLFRCNDGDGFFAHFRSDDDFNKLAVNNGFCGICIQLAVEGDDATKGGFGIGFKRQVVRLADTTVFIWNDSNTAWVGVLNDHTGRLGERLNGFQCGVGVGHIVVRQLFALQLFRCGDRRFGRLGFDIESGFLMRVFAVTHFLRFIELAVEGLREVETVVRAQGFSRLINRAQVVGDHAVVAGGMFKRFQCQGKTGFVTQTLHAVQVFQHHAVVRGVNHNTDVRVVFGGRAHHGRATDVDVFNGQWQVTVWLGDGRCKRVEVNHHQINRVDAVL